MSLLLALAGGGPTNYTLTCSAGSYVVGGQSAAINRSRLLNANAGAYTYAGTASNVYRSRLVTALAGAYAYTGSAATITYTPVAGAYTITAAAGEYTYAGSDATISRSGGTVGGGGYDDVKTKPKKKFFIEQDGKLLVFNTAQQAVSADKPKTKEVAQPETKPEATQEPEQVISLPVVQEYAQVSGLIEQYNTAYNSRHYEALIALFERMQFEQEEDDLEAILLAL
jgi:hypothetical protein